MIQNLMQLRGRNESFIASKTLQGWAKLSCNTHSLTSIAIPE